MKISKSLLFTCLLSVSLLSINSSCKKDKDTTSLLGNWIEQSDFEGVARNDAASFSIGNITYIGTGYDGEDRLRDFWAYNADNNSWTSIAPLSGISSITLLDTVEARNAAVAFSAAGKGYVGTGYNGETRLKDFYEYNPANNTWSRIADFGGSARYGAVAFSIDNIGYVGTGYDGNYLKDFWAYNPSTGVWAQSTSFGGSKRRDAVAFVIAGKGYVCTGLNNGNAEQDFYMFDPASSAWTPLRKIAPVSDENYDDDYTIVRSNAVAFTIGEKAYVTLGVFNNSYRRDVWEYDPSLDEWELKTSFEGSDRSDAIGFSTDDGKGFVTTGKNVSSQYDDIWEFKPEDEYNNED